MDSWGAMLKSSMDGLVASAPLQAFILAFRACTCLCMLVQPFWPPHNLWIILRANMDPLPQANIAYQCTEARKFSWLAQCQKSTISAPFIIRLSRLWTCLRTLLRTKSATTIVVEGNPRVEVEIRDPWVHFHRLHTLGKHVQRMTARRRAEWCRRDEMR